MRNNMNGIHHAELYGYGMLTAPREELTARRDDRSPRQAGEMRCGQSTSVWIVHNTLYMLMLLRNTIIMHGYRTVRCFADGKEVLELLRNGQRPDIILAGDDSTGMSGNDLLTVVENICEECRGILLVPPDGTAFTSRHINVEEGTAGFHLSLMDALNSVGDRNVSGVIQ